MTTVPFGLHYNYIRLMVMYKYQIEISLTTGKIKNNNKNSLKQKYSMRTILQEHQPYTDNL